jgi:hypothetical protein
VVFTTATNAVLPDLSPIGAALPGGLVLYWQAGVTGPADSVDELLDDATIEDLTRPRTRELRSATTGDIRAFTLAP